MARGDPDGPRRQGEKKTTREEKRDRRRRTCTRIQHGERVERSRAAREFREGITRGTFRHLRESVTRNRIEGKGGGPLGASFARDVISTKT